MKKNELPKLQLTKRTIANLNNMEMRYVMGGGGDDDGDISQKACEDDPEEKIKSEILDKAKKIILSHLIGCTIG